MNLSTINYTKILTTKDLTLISGERYQQISKESIVHGNYLYRYFGDNLTNKKAKFNDKAISCTDPKMIDKRSYEIVRQARYSEYTDEEKMLLSTLISFHDKNKLMIEGLVRSKLYYQQLFHTFREILKRKQAALCVSKDDPKTSLIFKNGDTNKILSTIFKQMGLCFGEHYPELTLSKIAELLVFNKDQFKEIETKERTR